MKNKQASRFGLRSLTKRIADSKQQKRQPKLEEGDEEEKSRGQGDEGMGRINKGRNDAGLQWVIKSGVGVAHAAAEDAWEG